MNNKPNQGNILGAMLRSVITNLTPSIEIGSHEMESLTQLCTMSYSPTGKEDPKLLVRSLSDCIVDAIVGASKHSISNPILRRLTQIFQIEWCFRHGYLNEDWKWEWNGSLEGNLHYSSTVPLEDIKELS